MKMMNSNINILLVEDDVNIRNYLRNLINNSNTGFAVIAEADNGLTGAQMAKKIRPDVIITDIFMPVMTGFEMLDELSEYHFETLVLSAYDDFQYFKLALKYGVTDYLLKPINEKDLFGTLNSIKEKLSGKQTEFQTDTLDFIRSHYLHDLFRNNTKTVNPDIFLTFLKNAQHPYFAAVYLTCSKDKTAALQASLKIHFPDFDIINLPPRGLFIIHNAETEFNFDDLYSEYSSNIHFNHIGISIPTSEDENIITALFGAYRCVEYQKLFPDERCFTDSQLPDRKVEINDLYERFNALYQHIEANNVKKCNEVLDLLFADAFFFNDFAKFKILIMRFIFHLENKYNTTFDTISTSTQVDVDKFEDIINLKEYIRKIVKNVIQEKNEETQKYHKAVREAISFIQENYATVTIEQVADKLFLSPSYLMYLFKQDTGETFYNYVIDYRISIACSLLSEGKKIYEVSEMVGYKSVKFFSTIFKKRTGLTPRDYAKQKHL